MKKMFALLLAVMLALTAVSALGQKELIGRTNLSLELTGVELYELDWEDIGEDMVMYFATENEHMACAIYEYSAEGKTLQELEAFLLEEEEGIQASGYTTINGIECFCIIISDEDGDFVVYFTLLNDEFVEFNFYYEDDTAELTGTIMNTLKLN